MITKQEFNELQEFKSLRFTITKELSSGLFTDYNVLIVRTDVYVVSIQRRSYDNKDYEFVRDAVDRLVIDSYEDLEWIIKAVMKYDNRTGN